MKHHRVRTRSLSPVRLRQLSSFMVTGPMSYPFLFEGLYCCGRQFYIASRPIAVRGIRQKGGVDSDDSIQRIDTWRVVRAPGYDAPGRDTALYVTYIRTTREQLWAALTTSEFTKKYWFGTPRDGSYSSGETSFGRN